MAGKPNTRNWNDVQLTIVSFALVLTLVLWNSFANPDWVKAQSQANDQATPTAVPVSMPMAAITPTPLPEIKIVFENTAAPQAYVPPAPQPRSGGGGRPRGGGGGGGGGGGTGGS